MFFSHIYSLLFFFLKHFLTNKTVAVKLYSQLRPREGDVTLLKLFLNDIFDQKWKGNLFCQIRLTNQIKKLFH